MKKIKSMLMFVLAMALMFSMTLTASAIDGAGDSAVSKSKTAKWVDTTNDVAEVSLSLPAEQTTAEVDVVLVIDKSMGSEGSGFPEKAKQMIEDLSQRTDMDLHMGVVSFDSTAHDMVNLASGNPEGYMGLVKVDATNKAVLQGAVSYDLKITDPSKPGYHANTPYIGGSNSESAIRMANKMLSEGLAGENNKYMYVFSDLLTYMYDGDIEIAGRTYKNVPCGIATNWGMPTDSGPLSAWITAGKYYTSFSQIKNAYYDGTMQARPNYNKNQPSRYNDQYKAQYLTDVKPAEYNAAVGPGGNLEFDYTAGYDTGFTKSMALTYDALKKASEQNYNVSLIVDKGAYGPYQTSGNIINEMLADVQTNFSDSVYESTSANMSDIVDKIQSAIINLFDKGSVKDVMGEDFNFCLGGKTLKETGNPFKLTVGGVEKTAAWNDATKTATYPDEDGDSFADYIITYDEASDSYNWEINTPVKKSAQVVLTYYVQLDQDKKASLAPGSYTSATNEVAEVNYWTSVENAGVDPAHTEEFGVPKLTYAIPTKPEVIEKPTNGPTTPTTKVSGVDTGDSVDILPYAIASIVALAGMVVFKKRKFN